jgi:hypothetical protein
LGQVRVEDPVYSDVHLPGIFWKYLLVGLEFLSYKVRKLTSRTIHTNLLSVVGPALSHFIFWRHVLLLLYLVLTMRKSTAISEAAFVILPIFAYFCFLFHFVRWPHTQPIVAFGWKFKLELLISGVGYPTGFPLLRGETGYWCAKVASRHKRKHIRA